MMSAEHGRNDKTDGSPSLASSRLLEAEICIKVLSNFTDQTLEGELPDEEFGRLLVAMNFMESNGSRPEPMRLLYASGSRLNRFSTRMG